MKKQRGLYQSKVNFSLACIQRPGNWAPNCKMAYSADCISGTEWFRGFLRFALPAALWLLSWKEVVTAGSRCTPRYLKHVLVLMRKPLTERAWLVLKQIQPFTGTKQHHLKFSSHRYHLRMKVMKEGGVRGGVCITPLWADWAWQNDEQMSWWVENSSSSERSDSSIKRARWASCLLEAAKAK